MAFFYKQEFTDQAEITIHHKFGVTPDVVSVHNAGNRLSISSVSHGRTKSIVTLPASGSGKVTLEISQRRVGNLRTSPDGVQWALFVTNEGVLQPVRVPTQTEDLADPAEELAARIAARTEELRLDIDALALLRYNATDQRKIFRLLSEAEISGKTNREAYLQPVEDWFDSLINYYSTKAEELSLATSFALLDAVTWDFSPYDQLYDSETAPLGDPEASVITAMGIAD